MKPDDIRNELKRQPFVPLRVHLTDGATIDVPFPHVAVLMRYGLLVFRGIKHAKSRQADGFEVFGFDRIERLERLAVA